MHKRYVFFLKIVVEWLPAHTAYQYTAMSTNAVGFYSLEPTRQDRTLVWVAVHLL